MIQPNNARQLAFIALREVHKGAYADVALDRVFQKVEPNPDKIPLDPRHRRLVTELVYGCTRRQRTLDALIDQLAKKKSHQQPKELRTILHLGLYQLCASERIPASAAVNTTVQLAKENGFAGLSSFVNGLLRQYIRNSQNPTPNPSPLAGRGGIFNLTPNPSPLAVRGEIFNPTVQFPLNLPENPVERLGILHSFPDWIVQVWLEQFGFSETEQLCEWMNQTPTIDLRINQGNISLSEVQAAFESNGVLARRIPYLPQALRLIGSSGAIQNLPGFNEGWWRINKFRGADAAGRHLNRNEGRAVAKVLSTQNKLQIISEDNYRAQA